MIEIARADLDPGERERWRLALEGPAVVAWREPSRGVEGRLVASSLWIGAYAVSVANAGPSWMHVLVAVAWCVAVDGALRAYRESASAWPAGRFLRAWGYVEVEQDVLRLVPASELALEVRPAALGAGPRLVLRSRGWSTRLPLTLADLPRVAGLLERLDDGARPVPEGYRGSPLRLDGGAPRWRRRRMLRMLAWSIPLVIVASIAPSALRSLGPIAAELVVDEMLEGPLLADLSHDTNVSPPYLRASTRGLVRGDLGELALDGCSTSPWVVGPVTGYLELALSAPRMGPARPFALPGVGRPGQRDGLWARCTWEVDRTSGLFARVRMAWGYMVDGASTLERRALLTPAVVLDAIDVCRAEGEPLDLSPASLSHASAALARAVILRDMVADLSRHRGPTDCTMETAAQVPVEHVLDPG